MYWWWLVHEWETHKSYEDRQLLVAPAGPQPVQQLVQQTQKKHLEPLGHIDMERHFGFQLQLWEKTLFYVADKVILETYEDRIWFEQHKHTDLSPNVSNHNQIIIYICRK